MRTLHTPGPSEIERLGTADLRRQFLLEDLFLPGQISMVATGLDRLIAGGVMPGPELDLDAAAELRAEFFHQRRETGIINIGEPGEIVVDRSAFKIGPFECLYIGSGVRRVRFRQCGQGQCIFYLLSSPAHQSFPTQLLTHAHAAVVQIGDRRSASERRIVRYIHEGGAQSCQLVMGYTELMEGSVWNTWPAHTHQRRSEIYLYCGLNGGLVTHFLGEPSQTRHIVVRERQAVLSPPWSIHSGVGTSAYRFIWGMAGENRTFEDMDPIDEAAFA